MLRTQPVVIRSVMLEPHSFGDERMHEIFRQLAARIRRAAASVESSPICSRWRDRDRRHRKARRDFDNVVVAQITASSQHPNADRLSVCQVDDGTGHNTPDRLRREELQGGDKVPLALPGAVLPNGLKIKSSKLRGVESQGMLCSATSSVLRQDSDGLLILSPEAKIGAPIRSLFPRRHDSRRRDHAEPRRSAQPLWPGPGNRRS